MSFYRCYACGGECHMELGTTANVEVVGSGETTVELGFTVLVYTLI